jgi:hypothetical protein
MAKDCIMQSLSCLLYLKKLIQGLKVVHALNYHIIFGVSKKYMR